MAGEILGGRFELGALTGSGAMGDVYQAVDTQTGQRVAVKVMSRDNDNAARFLREARILARLRHPHIVGFVDNGATPAGQPWLAMEWLDGENLSRRLARGPLSVAESVKLGQVLADTLGFVHSRGIVHRDLKPSNIFLVNGEVTKGRLLDFGIARLAAGERMTRNGILLGTPGYMAPEQVHGARTIDPRADIYSLGCVLFECLTGQPVFTGASVLAILAKIVLEPAPRLRDWWPDLPEALDRLLSRMLSKEPADRPETGQAAAEALREIEERGELGELSGEPTRVSPGTRTLTGSERRAIALILVGAGAGEPREDVPTAKPETLESATEASLRAEAALHGGRLVRLLDGAVAIELAEPSLATDLAVQAARCALALRTLAAGRPVALAIGRGEPGAEVPRGPAIDRGAALLAQRPVLEGKDLAAPVLLDEAQAGLLDARFDVREVRGSFVLLGERSLGDSARTLLGKATPCVGRERELGILEHLFEACVGENAAEAVLVTAQAGVGKSRLVQEWLRQLGARRTDVRPWIGCGDPLRVGSAFGLLGQLLRAACHVRDGEALQVRRDKVRARVAERVSAEARERVAEFLGEILGAPFSDEGSLPLRAARRDASLMNEQMRAAFLSFLEAECERGPVLLVLEDLHWSDEPSVAFVDRALAALRERPLFVLALARPEVRERFPRLWADRGLHELHLKELSGRAIERLVRHVLGDEISAHTVDRLGRLSDGNAFYLEELIRWAAERPDGSLPETVVTMVQSRLGALDDGARSALRVASIFGEVFWSGAVAALLGGRERTTSLRDRLRELAEGELLIRRAHSRFEGDDEYAFRHALLREGAYAMLTDEDRELGHRLAGEWLEQRGEGDPLVLAEHLEKGGDGPRAAMHYLAAAQRASAGSDTTRALDCIERGLALPLPREVRLRLQGIRCELHMYRIELSVTGLPEAKALLAEADQGSVAWTQALLLTEIGAAVTGDRRALTEALDAALGADFHRDALEAATILLGFGAAFSDHAGELRRSEAIIRRTATLVEPRADAEPSAALFYHLIITTRAAFADEDPWSGLEHARRAHALAESLGHRRYLLGSGMFMLVNSCFLGAHAEAARAATETEIPDHEFGLSSSVRPFALAWVLADQGALDLARAWAERLVSAGRSRGRPLDEARGHWAMAEVLRRAGETDAAEVAIGRATATLEEVCPLDQPGALATLAALRQQQQRPEEALAAAEDGMARYRSMGACGMFRGAFLRLVHAEALRAAGRERDACAAIIEARSCLLANAAKVGDPALRASFSSAVVENRRTLELARAWIPGEGPSA